jgi:hypothetical protein
MPGMIVENTTELINPNRIYQGRTDLTGTAQTIDLGAEYRNIELRLDAGASDIHYRLNPEGTTTDADTDDPMVTDADTVLDFLQVGISTVYIYSTGSTGAVNVRAW